MQRYIHLKCLLICAYVCTNKFQDSVAAVVVAGCTQKHVNVHVIKNGILIVTSPKHTLQPQLQ